MPFLERFSAAVDGLNDRIGSTIRWLALVMVLVGAFNAIARYMTRYTGFALSSNAYLDLQWYFFSLIFLLGAAYGLNHDVHVRVDVLYSRLSEKTRAAIDLAGTVLFLLPFSLLMLWVSWPPVRNSWAIREASPDPGGLPRYPIKAVILISFALLVLQGLSQVAKQVAVLRGGGSNEHPVGGRARRGRGRCPRGRVGGRARAERRSRVTALWGPAMFFGALLLIFSGYPVAFALGGTALLFAVIGSLAGPFDLVLLYALPERTFGTMSNYTLLAVPFFIFMGTVLEKSRLAEQLLETIGALFGRFRGGLGLGVIFVGALLAAAHRRGGCQCDRHGPDLSPGHAP